MASARVTVKQFRLQDNFDIITRCQKSRRGWVWALRQDEWKRTHQRSCQSRTEILTAGWKKKGRKRRRQRQRTKDTRSCLGRMNIARQWHWVYITFLFSASPLEYHPPPISNTLPHLSTAPNGHAKRPLIVLLLPRIHFDLLAVVRKQFSTNNLPAISVGLLRWYINFVLLYTGKKYFIIDRKTMLRTYDFTNNNSGQPITFDK